MEDLKQDSKRIVTDRLLITLPVDVIEALDDYADDMRIKRSMAVQLILQDKLGLTKGGRN